MKYIAIVTTNEVDGKPLERPAAINGNDKIRWCSWPSPCASR